ncbi:PAAR domain-containing protein [Nitrosomonas sp.]|uniref:PAAR domain-containing protein n=1 Tax=Nitrosomonas sp. TaxID=42353 RepID=UPI0025D55E04|nr:PAAR domain-containing protein [Nitrosomonas sp.]MBV6447284.1 hypothetical protein [Nitrosomonas sp.]
MPGVARVDQDVAGGLIIGVLAPSVFVNSRNIAVLGAQVQGHASGPHASPVMAESSVTVFANGIGVCKVGDQASCGHPTNGSNNVFAG